MQSVEHTQDSLYGMQPAGECAEPIPMHPDDFKAHLAWVIAKRFHELTGKETYAEKDMCRRIIG
jgi:hypothetical protein